MSEQQRTGIMESKDPMNDENSDEPEHGVFVIEITKRPTQEEDESDENEQEEE